MASFDSLKPLERSCLYNCRLLAGGKPGLKIASKGPSLQNFASTSTWTWCFGIETQWDQRGPRNWETARVPTSRQLLKRIGGQEVKGGPCHQGFPPVTGSPGHSRGRQSLSWRMRMLRQGSCRTESKRSRSGRDWKLQLTQLAEIGCSVHVKRIKI